MNTIWPYKSPIESVNQSDSQSELSEIIQDQGNMPKRQGVGDLNDSHCLVFLIYIHTY